MSTILECVLERNIQVVEHYTIIELYVEHLFSHPLSILWKILVKILLQNYK